MSFNKTDKFLYDVIEAYLTDHNIVEISVNDLMIAASCRYRDNRIFVKKNFRDRLLTMNSLLSRWQYEFSRAAAIFTILYSVRKQYPDFPEFWIIQELDNRVYPIEQDEFNPLILNAINNKQFDETIMSLVCLNDIEAFEHFLNEPTIKPHLHGDSVYQEIIEFIGENMEFRMIFMRVWHSENTSDGSQNLRL